MNNKKYERIAPLYDVLDGPYEVGWKRRLRKVVFNDLSGLVLDAGCGTGCNLPVYPRNARMIGVDNSPAMLVRARKRAEKHGCNVEFLERDLLRTNFPDAYFDHVVATFVFCVIPDDIQRDVLLEMRRICKPQGSIRILDYTMSKKAPVRTMMRIVSPWLNFAFSARYTAEPEHYYDDADLQVVEERFLVGDVVKYTTLRPAIAAAARRVAAG
ncbi:MAG: class I SAM-dependent methyltransferase [Azospirillaceae bacterium]|nr:class I SAM-dependent methyltransferase [Azospirillaceae bacterium]